MAARATVLDAGTLTIGNTVTAAATALTADSISIPGLVSDGGGGTTSLIATTGTISETGADRRHAERQFELAPPA